MIDTCKIVKPEEIMPLSVDELANMSAFQCLWECNKSHLNQIALTYSADTNLKSEKKPLVNKITYKELFNNIVKTYHALKLQGVKEGDIITYASITTPELIYTMYASNLIGAIFDPIDLREKTEGLLTHFNNEPSRLFFTPEAMFDNTLPIYGDINVDRIITLSMKESLPKIVQIGAKILERKQGIKAFESPDKQMVINWNEFSSIGSYNKSIPTPKFEKDKLISLTHTTGTTGVPKALKHSNENWNAQVYNTSYSGLQFVRGERLFDVACPWVDFGLINAIHIFLSNGITLNLDPTWTPDNNVDFFLKYKPEWWLGAPGWIDPLFTDSQYKNSDVSFNRYILTGGAPLFAHKQVLYQNKLENEFNCKGQVVQGYGCSEATAAVAIDQEKKPGVLGKILPIFEYKIQDPQTGEIKGIDESGELWIASKYDNLSPIALGYLNNEAEDKKAFLVDENGKKWVRTGDRVHEDFNRVVTWESRYKNILTFNGFNINCDKLLDAVENFKGVNKGAIIGAITEDGNQRPIICIDKREEYNGTDEELRSGLFNMINEHFAEYYEPLDIVVYEEIPTKTMKINLQQIKQDLLNENGEYTLKRKLK